MQSDNQKAAEGATWRSPWDVESQTAEYRSWCGAVFCTLILHGVILGVLIRTPSDAENTPLPPPALMVTLAEIPQAINTEQNNISAETTQSEASDAQAEAEPPPEQLPDIPEVKNEPQPTEIKLPPPVPKRPPPKRPTAPAKVVEKTAQAPAASEAQTAAKAAIRAQAQVTPSQQNSAPQANAGVQASQQAVVTWKSQVMARLERFKRYPAAAQMRGNRGVAYVRFSLDGSGNVTHAELAQSSGFAALDSEVVALAYRASPLPAPPDKKPLTLTAPVSFMKR